MVIIKAAQFHPVTDKRTHIDFLRISLTEKIKVKVHLKLVGECYGAKVQGGLVEHTMREVNVSCLPTEIPHEIVVDITELHINNSLRVKDVKLGKFDLLDARIVHRVTTVQAGDNIVFIAAGAAHRAAAFDACRWMIDELKQRVPIWKKEVTPEGESWVTQHP